MATEAQSCFNFSILTKAQEERRRGEERGKEREEEMRREQQVMMSEQVMLSSWVVEVGGQLLSGGQVQVKAELSDGSFFLLNRTNEDLARMMKRLLEGFPDDQEMLSFRLFSDLWTRRRPDVGTGEGPGVQAERGQDLETGGTPPAQRRGRPGF